MRTRGVPRTVLFAALTAMLFFLAVEGLLRLAWNPEEFALEVETDLSFALSEHRPYIPDPVVIYRFKPRLTYTNQGVDIRLNSEGLRSPEIGEKAPGCFRILNLGDSSTFGSGVLEDQTYSRQLERILGERTKKCVEAINAGVPGYTSTQGLAYLRQNIDRLRPDLVTTYFEPNDAAFSYPHSDSEFLRIGPWKRKFSQAANRIYIYLLIKRVVFQYRYGEIYRLYALFPEQARQRPIPIYELVQRAEQEGIELPRFLLKTRVSEQEYPDNHRQMESLCKSRGCAILFLPYVRLVYGDMRYCSRCRIHPYVDLFDRIAPHKPHSELFVDDFHPSPLGHRLIAEALADRILADGLLTEAD